MSHRTMLVVLGSLFMVGCMAGAEIGGPGRLVSGPGASSDMASDNVCDSHKASPMVGWQRQTIGRIFKGESRTLAWQLTWQENTTDHSTAALYQLVVELPGTEKIISNVLLELGSDGVVSGESAGHLCRHSFLQNQNGEAVSRQKPCVVRVEADLTFSNVRINVLESSDDDPDLQQKLLDLRNGWTYTQWNKLLFSLELAAGCEPFVLVTYYDVVRAAEASWARPIFQMRNDLEAVRSYDAHARLTSTQMVESFRLAIEYSEPEDAPLPSEAAAW